MSENTMKEKMIAREKQSYMRAIANCYSVVMSTNKLGRALSAYRNCTTLISITSIFTEDVTKMVYDMENAIKKLVLETEV